MEWNVDRLLAVCGIGTGIILAAVAIGVGLGMDTRTQGELRFVQGCFIFSAIALFAPLVFFVVHTTMPILRRSAVVGFASLAIAICLSEGLRWVGGRHSAKPDSQFVEQGHAQSQTEKELAEVNDFICKKDEGDLREEFDFPQMLKFNIEFAKQKLDPALVSPDQAAAISTYFLNGQARIDMRYARLTTINNRVNVDWIPGKIGVINTSKKYNESRKRLATLMSSAALPADVTAALRLLDDSIEKDSALMIESLNKSLVDDPRNILQNSVYGSNWYGSASGLYWKQFIPLRPSADVVTLAVRKAMEARKQSQAAATQQP